MTALSDEPAVRFWLSYAEREGALVEDAGDHALLLLPEPLRRESELPEEVVVTPDPDLAREAGAVLLIPGHPALERAAAAVLATGDTGHAYLAWPGSRPPTRSTLEARARELVGIEHGRIDAAGEPAAAYAPLLRVGVTISYIASLTLQFHEQEEAWVDGRTGIAVGERALAAIRDRPWRSDADPWRRVLAADLDVAVPAAHGQLERRAVRRQASLAAHAQRALESELRRADAYYQAVLESIASRRSKAPADRVPLLDAQSQATRDERARRRHEIEEQFSARHAIRPFRLHLVHVPAYVLAVDVRRGSRTFPLSLTFLPIAGEFTALRCPACGAAEALVASRDRLGCRACTPGARGADRSARSLPALLGGAPAPPPTRPPPDPPR